MANTKLPLQELSFLSPPIEMPASSYRPALAHPIYRLDPAPDRANGGKNAAIKPAIDDCGQGRVPIGELAALKANRERGKGEDAQ
ncbi:MAG TPA: hypothetical protein VFU49_15605 [Ktedonobacteraceae bacterium]|nr:hypothetical protein [Ktedonobacteraceae bacterium]